MNHAANGDEARLEASAMCAIITDYRCDSTVPSACTGLFGVGAVGRYASSLLLAGREAPAGVGHAREADQVIESVKGALGDGVPGRRQSVWHARVWGNTEADSLACGNGDKRPRPEVSHSVTRRQCQEICPFVLR